MMLPEFRISIDVHRDRKYLCVHQQRDRKYENNKSELKYAIANMKNTPEGINSRLEDAEDKIRIMEDRVLELTQLEWQKEIKNFLKGHTYKGALGQHKYTDFHNIGVPEGEEREKGTENEFERTVAENSPNVLKENVIQAQEAQKLPTKINSKRPTERHIMIKM